MRSPGNYKEEKGLGSVSRLIADNRKAVVKAAVILVILAASLVVHLSSSHDDIVIERASDDISEISTDAAGSEDTAEYDDQRVSDVPIYVDISGAVNSPGVYEVPQQTRLFELISKAGGLKDNADIDSINRAAYVADGDKIVIPEKGGETVLQSSDGITRSADGKVNINNASKEELMNLPGVGDAIADRIIEYRSESRFQRIEDIKNVSGIGDATFEKMKGQLSV